MRSLDRKHDFQVESNEDMTVRDLCDIIFSLTDIPPENIRLYQFGRFIATGNNNNGLSSERLAHCRIDCSSTIHFSELSDDNSLSDSLSLEQPVQHFKAFSNLTSRVNDALVEALHRTIRIPAGGQEETRKFVKRVEVYCKQISEYEDKERQKAALHVMPEAHLRAEATRRRSCEDALCSDELALTAALLRWFKRDFFKWVNSPSCDSCGDATTFLRVETPKPSELWYAASRTEVFACTCGREIRFPRFEDVVHLLKTRRGRCGEWAKTFTLCARALGLRARLVHDWTDHVWTEIWCGSRWVHADSCEEALDQPLLYEEGWGKKLTYCIATGVDSVLDVTRRYTANFEDVCTRRTLVLEVPLGAAIVRMDELAKSRLPSEARLAAHARWIADISDMNRSHRLRTEDVRGRESGSKEWIAARGEDGSQR